MWYPVNDFEAEDDERQSRWVRVYHQSGHTPTPLTRRVYGPTARFDPHTVTDPDMAARECPQRRAVIYLAKTLGTALAEVFGMVKEAEICPNYRVAALAITHRCHLQDLTSEGCMALDTVTALSQADVPRPLTQQWARAIYEDEPAGRPVDGIIYNGAHDHGLCLALFERAPMLHLAGGTTGSALGEPLLGLQSQVERALRRRSRRFRAVDAKECKRCREAATT
jgi:RES domain-containing protein